MYSKETGWGGSRENSGRSKLHKVRKNITISLYQEQWDQINEILENKKKNNPKLTETNLITQWTLKGANEDIKDK